MKRRELLQYFLSPSTLITLQVLLVASLFLITKNLIVTVIVYAIAIAAFDRCEYND